MRIYFTDGSYIGDDNGFIGVFINDTFKGSIKTYQAYLEMNKDITHIAALTEYGSEASVTRIYPKLQVQKILIT